MNGYNDERDKQFIQVVVGQKVWHKGCSGILGVQLLCELKRAILYS